MAERVKNFVLHKISTGRRKSMCKAYMPGPLKGYVSSTTPASAIMELKLAPKNREPMFFSIVAIGAENGKRRLVKEPDLELSRRVRRHLSMHTSEGLEV